MVYYWQNSKYIADVYRRNLMTKPGQESFYTREADSLNYTEFDRLEWVGTAEKHHIRGVKIDEDGSEKKRALAVGKFVAGYDKEQKPYTPEEVEAIYKMDDKRVVVTVDGVVKVEDGTDYLHVKESFKGLPKQGIPRSELDWLPGSEEDVDTTEYAKVLADNKNLRDELGRVQTALEEQKELYEAKLKEQAENHDRKIEELNNQFQAQMTKMRQDMRKDMNELRTKLEDPARTSRTGKRNVIGTWKPKKDEQITLYDGKKETSVKVKKVDRENNELKVVDQTGNRKTYSLTTAAEYRQNQITRKRNQELANDESFRGRVRGFYNRHFGRQPEIVPVVVDEGGEPAVRYEEVEEERSYGTGVIVAGLGIAALAGAIVGIALYEASEDDGHPKTAGAGQVVISQDKLEELQNEAEKYEASIDQNTEAGSVSFDSQGRAPWDHGEVYPGGHRNYVAEHEFKTAIDLPPGWRVEEVGDHIYDVVDTNGKVRIRGLNFDDKQFDRQGFEAKDITSAYLQQRLKLHKDYLTYRDSVREARVGHQPQRFVTGVSIK
jgi:hypothetical protein